ncbi:MAG: hypothetical protein JWQ72_1781, partial [Polaromonas sp.]|nr:hypothetical protein [Polaromonas sp.]
PGGRAVFRATARAVLDTTLPPEHAAQQAAIGQLLQRIDILIGALHPYSRAELSQLLSLLDSAAGRRVLAGLDTPWQDASTVDVQHALQGMRLSSLALRRQAYAALHDITSGAYFSDPSSWPVLGYPGPLKI